MLPYVILISIFSYLSEFRYQGKHILRIPALIFLILFIGLRNEIGKDYLAYKDIFLQSNVFDFGEIHGEIGWFYLNRLIRGLTDNFKVLTLVHAVIVVSFLYYTLKDFKYYTLGFILFILALPGYIAVVNIMRQGAAMAIFVYAWKYIQNREALKYWILILFGATFHLSILFVAPLYWVAYRPFNSRLCLIVQFITLLFFFTHSMDVFFTKLMSYTPYATYIESRFMRSNINSGLGFLVRRVGCLFVLIYFGRLLKYYPQYTVWFNMYFIMIISRDLFANIFILERISKYFTWSSFVVVPLFLSLIFKSGYSRRLALGFMLIIYFVLFAYTVYTDTGNNLLYTF